MRVIADSSSTRTEWVLLEGQNIVEQVVTEGLNPYFHSRREISHIIRLQLPESFFKRRWQHVHFYGAGCASPEKCKLVESSLVAQFKTPVTVESDLLGAARGLLINRPGIACILGTGSNSCYYDGKGIVKSVRPLGFILGDEGSNSYMGKILVSDILKEVAPRHIINLFRDRFILSPDEIMDSIYTSMMPTHHLSEYASFLRENLEEPYVQELVYNAFMNFFRRNIIHYDYANTTVNFVGGAAVAYSDILNKAALDFGIKVGEIKPRSMPGLIQYHAENL